MKRIRLFLIGFAMTVAVSCILKVGGIGGGSSGGLFSDPSKGLDELSHYRADLTVSTKAQASGQTIDSTKKFSLAVWTAEKAIFQTVDSFDDAGQPIKIPLGTVGQAGYILLGGDTGCQTFWDDTNIHIDAASLAPYLVALKSGTLSGDDTVEQDKVHAIADLIPFGQPILMDHHSEAHAGKDAERIDNGMRRSCEEFDKKNRRPFSHP